MRGRQQCRTYARTRATRLSSKQRRGKGRSTTNCGRGRQETRIRKTFTRTGKQSTDCGGLNGREPAGEELNKKAGRDFSRPARNLRRTARSTGTHVAPGT